MKPKYVWVTHPNQPNYEPQARGRKIHIAKNKKMSFCNMLIVSESFRPHDKYRDVCKVCSQKFNQIAKEKNYAN